MTPWKNEQIVMLDVETTGTHPTARIVQMASVVGIAGKLVRKRVTLVNPGEPIPEGATKIHRITNAMVADAPRFLDLAEAVHERIHSGLPAAYNAPFDRRVFAHELALAGKDMQGVAWIDPLPWVRDIDGWWVGNALPQACQRRRIPLRAHDALSDACASLQLLYAIANRLPDDLEELRKQTEVLRERQRQDAAGYARRKARREAAVAQGVKDLEAKGAFVCGSPSEGKEA